MPGISLKFGQATFQFSCFVRLDHACVVIDPSTQGRNFQCQRKRKDCRDEQGDKPGKEEPCFVQLHLLLRTLPAEAWRPFPRR